MKIYTILDHAGYNKTMPGVIKKWEEAGHEVVRDMYYDINKINWCDIVYGEYIQGGVVEAVNDENNTKPTVVRGIDIDLYFGHYMGLDFDRCKALLFINDYIREWSLQKYFGAKGKMPQCPVKTVKLGTDLNDWLFRKREKGGKTIGWLNEFYSGKGVQLLAQVIYETVKKDSSVRFEVVGNTTEVWLEKYFEEFLKRNKLEGNVNRIQSVASVDKWMDKLDYILSTGMKECMSLPLIEAMAKGIKPVIHSWWGADQLYPPKFVYDSAEQASCMFFDEEYNSEEYRDFVDKNYNLDTQVKQLNEIMGI